MSGRIILLKYLSRVSYFDYEEIPQFQKFTTLIKELASKTNGADVEDLIELFEGITPASVKIVAEQAAKCPKCGGALGLLRVNHKPEYMVGGDLKYLIYCTFIGKCGYESYRTDILDKDEEE